MSVKSFKFVSPGVFINEIDNSFVPQSADAIGPVVIGRSARGPAMVPVKVSSYSDFVNIFGNTVAGGNGRDVYRDGNLQSPMYGTYAAKAFLQSNVAPLTYVRLLGTQTSQGSSDGGAGAAGWKTLNSVSDVPDNNGGAYGLWLFTSGAVTQASIGTGSLAAIFYVEDGQMTLSGTVYGGVITNDVGDDSDSTGSNGVVIGQSGTNNLFTVLVSGSQGISEKLEFNFDDSSDNYIRKKCNTNPQLVSGTTFYGPSTGKSYWLGETYDQELRDRAMTSGSVIGCMFAISKGTSAGPWDMESQAYREGRTGWFVGQDLGAPGSYVSFRQPTLFRLVGRGHGEWLQKNVKISIEKVRQSNNTIDDYGTFSLILRNIYDSDNAIEVMERFDNLSLDPSSPNYVARRIGDKYTQWDSVERRLKTYGEYDNHSNFVYVEMNADVDAGATDAALLPFGYFGPPRFRSIFDLNGSGACNLVANGGTNEDGSINGSLSNLYVTGGTGIVNAPRTSIPAISKQVVYLSGGMGINEATKADDDSASCTGSLVFPVVRLRTSASDGGMADYSRAYFGMQTSRTANSTVPDKSIPDFHRLLYTGYDQGGGSNASNPFATTGVEDYAYVFSLDDIVLKDGSSTDWFYVSGSRARGASYTSGAYTELLDAGINRYTVPIWGGFDGFNIKKPDPVYNGGMSATATQDNSYIYNTWKRAIDTVSDPEQVEMNVLVPAGLTNDSLTTHAVRTCEARGDALSLIDLANVYIPPHEAYYASKSSRIGTTPVQAAKALKARRVDSSYGATFYPWVQTRDELSGRALWIPPSVAMLGVLGTSERSSYLWFAPAGFNRGGLTDGAAGIPVSGVTERLISRDRDTLYEAHINPIASFPSSGIVVFGQKTLQERQSALDRINVRRLVIYLKKQISILSTKILFEQNVQATWNRFTALIEPFLASVQAKFGITEYKLILDSTTTTPDLIDQNILYAKIMVKPARAIEYIAIDFVISSTGASFDD